MTLRLNSTGGGHIEIDAPNTASNFSVTMPTTAGEVVVADASGDIETTRTGTGGSSASALVVGYQQGTWTPGFVAGVNMGTGITNVACTWTRVGNLVTIWMNFHSSDATGNTAVSDQIQINGVPYNIDESENNSIPFLCVQSQGRTNNSQWWGSIFWETGVPETRLTFRAFNLVSTNTRIIPIRGVMSYITDNTDWTPINGATVS